jgi:uncharacterized membrane protein YhaH (DUF805 family)
MQISGSLRSAQVAGLAPPDFFWARVAPDLLWLALAVPGVAAISRRLQDTLRSPSLVLLPLPMAGAISFLIVLAGMTVNLDIRTYAEMGKHVGAHLKAFVLFCSLPLFWFLSRPSTYSPNPSEAPK